MGKRTCPRCGANDRSHEVKVEMREHGGRNKAGDGIRVCAGCAGALRNEISNLLQGARLGFIAELGVPMMRELDEERQDRNRVGEYDPDHKLYYWGNREWRAEKPPEGMHEI